jgi:hypothetical protein
MIAPVIVSVTVDREHGIALVRGKMHDPLVLEVAPGSKWSKAGGGWVLTLREVADLHSLCWALGAIYRERERAA